MNSQELCVEFARRLVQKSVSQDAGEAAIYALVACLYQNPNTGAPALRTRQCALNCYRATRERVAIESADQRGSWKYTWYSREDARAHADLVKPYMRPGRGGNVARAIMLMAEG